MKLGFQNKREVAVMIFLVLIAAVVGSYFLFNGPSTATATKAPSSKTATRGTTTTAGRSRRVPFIADLQPSRDPSLKFNLLKSSEEKEYDGGKRNIFREQVEEIKIEQPVKDVIKSPPIDPGPPPPPPINLKFYGFASRPGEARKVFLSSGDEVFVAEEGQIIQRRYKIGKITATSVEVEDVLNNNKQTILLTQ